MVHFAIVVTVGMQGELKDCTSYKKYAWQRFLNRGCICRFKIVTCAYNVYGVDQGKTKQMNTKHYSRLSSLSILLLNPSYIRFNHISQNWIDQSWKFLDIFFFVSSLFLLLFVFCFYFCCSISLPFLFLSFSLSFFLIFFFLSCFLSYFVMYNSSIIWCMKLLYVPNGCCAIL